MALCLYRSPGGLRLHPPLSVLTRLPLSSGPNLLLVSYNLTSEILSQETTNEVLTATLTLLETYFASLLCSL